jgi:hypothetical protein
MNKRRIAFGVSLGAVLLLAASCATLGYWGTTNPPIARLTVTNFDENIELYSSMGIDFSVRNVTDQDLTGLTLTVTQNPSNGLKLPYTEMTIDRIPAHGSWAPANPFVVEGREAGPSVVFFTVTKDGKFLAKDYTMINVSRGEDNDRGLTGGPR